MTNLEVRKIPVLRGSAFVVPLTLAYIFPRMGYISSVDGDWKLVMDAMRRARDIVDHTSKEHPFSVPRSAFSDTLPGAALGNGG